MAFLAPASAKDAARIQSYERTVAVADWDCAGASDPGEALRDVLRDLESRAA